MWRFSSAQVTKIVCFYKTCFIFADLYMKLVALWIVEFRQRSNVERAQPEREGDSNNPLHKQRKQQLQSSTRSRNWQRSLSWLHMTHDAKVLKHNKPVEVDGVVFALKKLFQVVLQLWLSSLVIEHMHWLDM